MSSTSHDLTTGRKRGQSTKLAERLGQQAQRELTLPLCFICSTQTDYSGDDLQIDSQDSEYKCPICSDPRQYVGIQGQKWTTLEKLHQNVEKCYRNDFDELIPDKLWTFKTRPSIGIGQRAFLMKDPAIDGLIMWDCVAYLNDETLNKIEELSNGKGIAHMVVSHPHYYSTTAVWAAAFSKMKLWLAEVDFYDWYQRSDIIAAKTDPGGRNSGVSSNVPKQIQLVTKEQTLLNDSSSTKILLLGGHFPGSLVFLWEDCLFIADTIQVVPSGLYKSDAPQRKGVTTFSFMWSYPNQIPLSAAEVARVCEPLEKIDFDKAYGAFEGFNILGHAKAKIFQSRDIFLNRLGTA